MTPEQACAYLPGGASFWKPSRLKMLRVRDQGPRFHRLGRNTVMYKREDLDAWVESTAQGGSAAAVCP